MLHYTPPKSQNWGHSCDHLSAVELVAKVQQFLHDHTLTDEGFGKQSLTVQWTALERDPLADAISISKKTLSNTPEAFERTDPTGSTYYKLTWALRTDELPFVAEWLDQHHSNFDQCHALVQAHRHVAYRWLPIHRGEHMEFPLPSVFGVNLSRPRSISIPSTFYNAEHYRKIKGYMKEIGLAELSDKYLKPKGAL